MRASITEGQLREIYAETIDALYEFASRRCGGVRESAEDVAQETWLRAVREWPRMGVPATPIAWLKTVARNLILNQLRRREAESLDAVSPADIMNAVEDGDIGDSAEVASVVNRALEKLPSAEAQLLEAFHYERIKIAQIANAYGISERAVEGRLRRARERLRRELELTLKAEGGLI